MVRIHRIRNRNSPYPQYEYVGFPIRMRLVSCRLTAGSYDRFIMISYREGRAAGSGAGPYMQVVKKKRNRKRLHLHGLWAIQDLNLGPRDYESPALTN